VWRIADSWGKSVIHHTHGKHTPIAGCCFIGGNFWELTSFGSDRFVFFHSGLLKIPALKREHGSVAERNCGMNFL
jgi:hypothetical protein